MPFNVTVIVRALLWLRCGLGEATCGDFFVVVELPCARSTAKSETGLNTEHDDVLAYLTTNFPMLSE